MLLDISVHHLPHNEPLKPRRQFFRFRSDDDTRLMIPSCCYLGAVCEGARLFHTIYNDQCSVSIDD